MEELLPLATVITPNLMEGEVLSGMKIRSKADMEKAAAAIISRDIQSVLLKGGHLADTADDMLAEKGKVTWFAGKRIENPNTHGTGCSLSSAVASELAAGCTLEEAVRKAKAYVALGIANGLPVGHGHGPIHHFVDLYKKGGLF
jgi:hydroxymethylpyrimidine/phosphomethylpyrimidine kinase